MGNATFVQGSREGLDLLGVADGILNTTILVLHRDQRRFVFVGPLYSASLKAFIFCRDLRTLPGASSHPLAGVVFCGRSG